jgi:hypothetical protein
LALRLVYDSKEQLEPSVWRLLFPEVQDHVQQHPTYTTRNWLQINGPVLRESLRRAKRQTVAGVRSIRSYFAPVRWFWQLVAKLLDVILSEKIISSRADWPPRRERRGSTVNWYLVFFVFLSSLPRNGTWLRRHQTQTHEQ